MVGRLRVSEDPRCYPPLQGFYPKRKPYRSGKRLDSPGDRCSLGIFTLQGVSPCILGPKDHPLSDFSCREVAAEAASSRLVVSQSLSRCKAFTSPDVHRGVRRKTIDPPGLLHLMTFLHRTGQSVIQPNELSPALSRWSARSTVVIRRANPKDGDGLTKTLAADLALWSEPCRCRPRSKPPGSSDPLPIRLQPAGKSMLSKVSDSPGAWPILPCQFRLGCLGSRRFPSGFLPNPEGLA